jgi:molybdopterin molybdotransferase
MISVRQAKKIIAKHSTLLANVTVHLSKAAGRTLAEAIYSSVDIPAFNQSSVDGFAFNFSGYKKYNSLNIIDKIPAGYNKKIAISENEAVRIFTGAPIPIGADTVVMQEKTLIKNNFLFITDKDIKPGTSFRKQGAEIRKSKLAIQKGTLLTPAAIGFLAGIGIKELSIYPSPIISVIITGNELQTPGKSLMPGQVYESNSIALIAALKNAGVDDIKVFFVKDDLAKLTATLKKTLEISDMVLLTGGVSVGDYDFVVKAAENCKVEKLFHKVKQKPGKPLFFGRKNNIPVFGLPGNPSSVLSCFYHFVLLSLGKMTGRKCEMKEMNVVIASSINKTLGLTHFLKGVYDGSKAKVLNAQESFRMASFANANCLIEVDEKQTSLKAGDIAKIYLLPDC